MIVTTLRERRLTAEETQGRITDLFFEDPEEDSMVGRIYVGTVKQIRTNIQAAFVELGDGLMAYYPLEDWERFPVEGVPFREGAQIPVMVIKDAQKTKAPTVTTALTFTGQYLVLTPSKQGLFFSSRLNDPEPVSYTHLVLERKEIIEKSLDNYGHILIAKDLDEAIEAVNDIASEHLEIMTKDAFTVMTKIKNAGAIFIGEHSCEPLGDYFAGPNHVLPTNGTAKFFSPLGVDDFIKKSSIISYSREALEPIHEDIMRFAAQEGLTAHRNSIKVRFE